jgi:flagellar basal body-associated protein FliL
MKKCGRKAGSVLPGVGLVTLHGSHSNSHIVIIIIAVVAVVVAVVVVVAV